MEVGDYRYFFFDLDRTIWNWDELIIGAADLIDSLREADKQVFFHTDNTLLSRNDYARKLTDMGIPTEESDVMTSGYVAGEYLSEKSVTDCYVIGEQGLMEEINERDIEIREGGEKVVAGFDRSFSYEKARKALKVMENGGEAVLCGKESFFRTSKGVKPNQGGFNAAIRSLGDSRLAGKPGELFRNSFRDYFDYFPDRSVMIGDRLEDIETGNRLGMTTVAVFSGEIDEEKLKQADEVQRPDYGLSSLPKLKRKII